MARLVSEGRKKEFTAFGWNPESIPDPEKRETFERSKLKWDEVSAGEHAEMLAWYRQLIRLRRAAPSLNNGEPGQTRVSYDQQERWLCMERGDVTMICNLGETGRRFPVAVGSRVVLGSRGAVMVTDGAVMLPPDTAVIVSRSGMGIGRCTENAGTVSNCTGKKEKFV
jgi:maltooligosyltrehalose trehalohydrolase